MNKTILILVVVFVISTCDQKKKAPEQSAKEIKNSVTRVFPEDVAAVFNSHGGYEKWQSMSAMKFKLSKGEEYKVALKSRNVNIKSEKWIIGSNKETVWITPDTVTFSDPRFYHSLYYYFVSMPFVLGDAGISYSPVDDVVFNDTTYAAVKISFAEGVGDAPKDNYFICYDKETKQMRWLMYTVTYGEDASNEDYGLIRYADWLDVDGLIMPERLVWYRYNDGVNIERRSQATISDWSLSKEPFSDSLFMVPKNARLVD